MKKFNSDKNSKILKIAAVSFAVGFLCSFFAVFHSDIKTSGKALPDAEDIVPVLGAPEADEVSKPDTFLLTEEYGLDPETVSIADGSRNMLKAPMATPTDYQPDALEKGLEATLSDAEAASKTVYLTFDDGPSPNTDAILDILREEDVKATFFVVTNRHKYDPQMKRIVDEGHTIGVHSYSHDYSEIYSSIDSFKDDVTRAHDDILRVTGVDTRFYRFPGGSSNQVSDIAISDCAEFLGSEGYVYYDWNAISGDSEGESDEDALVTNALKYIKSNDGDTVLLLHDLETHDSTVKGLRSLIREIKALGYDIKPVTDDTEPVQHRVF